MRSCSISCVRSKRDSRMNTRTKPFSKTKSLTHVDGSKNATMPCSNPLVRLKDCVLTYEILSGQRCEQRRHGSIPQFGNRQGKTLRKHSRTLERSELRHEYRQGREEDQYQRAQLEQYLKSYLQYLCRTMKKAAAEQGELDIRRHRHLHRHNK